MSERAGGWIQTATGGQFWPLDPRADEVRLRDIAHALSHLCRFGGHCLTMYSVAEHSVRVARLAKAEGASRLVQSCALLHDSAEAYILDLPRPIKKCVVGYAEAEARVEAAIEHHFGFLRGALSLPEIKGWDQRLLATEARDVMLRKGHVWTDLAGIEPLEEEIVPWTSHRACSEFLGLAWDLGL